MTFLCVLMILRLFPVYSAFQDQQEVRGKLGQNVSLRCVGPRDAEIKLFTWTKDGLQDYVFFYRNDRPYRSYQHESVRGRVHLSEESALKDGDFSVVLQNLISTDAGTYMCRIVTENPGGADGDFKSFIHLRLSGTEEEEGSKNRGDEGTADSNTLMLAVVGIIGGLLVLIIVCSVLIRTSGLSKRRLSHVSVEEQQLKRTGAI